MQKLAVGVLVLGVLGGLGVWSNRHDEALAVSMARYESCVKERYHTNPGAYYLENGEYPVCE